SCVFCQIVVGERAATIIHQDALVTAFRDINPQAPTHILIIPNEHIPGIAEIEEQHGDLVARMFATANHLAHSEGLSRGYRLVLNQGPLAGQSVFHLHLHLLGGRAMRWPPG
ncbi:MAG: histidine triad nucleotide-binding protein, partial [Chloroflexi bacterium]|nr:histidine triad nucleotide-binding protein [Chloroflexota bacterium]